VATESLPLWRRVVGVLLGLAAVTVIALLVLNHFPSEFESLSSTTDTVAKIEGQTHLSAIVAVDLALVLQSAAFVTSALGLVFLCQVFAKFYASAVSLVLENKFRPVVVKDTMPPLRWFALPVLALGISLALTKIYQYA